MTTTFTLADATQEPRPVWASMRRGAMGRCPRCGVGRMFRAYLKVNDACPACGEDMHHQRADDAPPYITIMIVGHTVLGLMLMMEFLSEDIPVWTQMVTWPALALVLSLGLLPIVKGALVAYQWALRMHGFEGGTQAFLPFAGGRRHSVP